MSDGKRDETRAFPWTMSHDDAPGRSGDRANGMSLRDYFAAAALTGMLSKGGAAGWEHVVPQAYKIANAMMEARENDRRGA